MLLRCPNPECHKVLEAPDRLAGRHVKCPACGVRFYAPSSLNIDKDPSMAAENPAVGQQLSGPTVVMGAEESTGDELLGRKLGGCKIESKLGEGGMGAVYKARHIGLDKDVAVKVVPRYLAEKSKQFVERFQREARAAARLDHPNIVKVHNVGEEQGHHFMVMEYIEGESLKEMLTRVGPLDVEVAISIFHQILAALVAAHGKGIIHRDIKPDNILLRHLEPGETGSSIEMQRSLLGSSDKARTVAKLADLGLAKVQDTNSEGYTMSGVMLGTVDYMAPEQAEDAKNVDARADLYALGCTLFHMLSGRKPFPGASMMEVMMKHVTADIPQVGEFRDDVPVELEVFIGKMMAKKADDRYQTANEILDDLSAFVASMTNEIPVIPAAANPDMVICPNATCRKPNRRGAKWCAGCGESLVEKCLKCGADVFIGESFCIHCGTSLEDERKILAIVAEARSLLAEKRHREVVVRLEEVLSLDPDREDALSLKERAEPVISRIDALVEKAAAADLAEDFEAVQAALREALELCPHEEGLKSQLDVLPQKIVERDVRIGLSNAEEAWDGHRPHEAEEHYRRVLALDGENEPAVLGIETCQALYHTIEDKKQEMNEFLESRELKKAKTICDSILQLDTEDEEARALQEDLADRFEQVNEALSSSGILMQSQKWGEAIKAWQTVLDVWPSHEKAIDGLASSQAALQEFNDLSQRARSLADERDLGQAEEALEHALQAGFWEEGVELLKRIRADKESAEASMSEAWESFKRKDWNAAIAGFQNVLAAWPSHAAARKGLEDSETSQRTFQELVEATRVPLEERSLSDAEHALIQALDAGYWEEGRELLVQIEADLKEANTLLKRAQTSIDDRNWADAQEALRNAQELWPDHPTCKHLFEQANKNQEVFNELRNNAESLFNESRLSSALPALEAALDAGSWPDGAKMLLEAQEHADSAQKETELGVEAADSRKWRQALDHFEAARALDTEAVDTERMEQVSKLARDLDSHVAAIRELAASKKYDELRLRASEADRIGADDEIERFRQQTELKLSRVQELEQSIREYEQQNRPTKSVAALAEILDIQPDREDIRRQHERFSERVSQAEELLAKAKESFRRRNWLNALHQANDALEFDGHLQAAQDLAKQAMAAAQNAEQKKKLFASIAAALILLLVLGAYISYRSTRKATVSSVRVAVTNYLDDAKATQSRADITFNEAEQKLRQARKTADAGAADDAEHLYHKAVDGLKIALATVAQAEERTTDTKGLEREHSEVQTYRDTITSLLKRAEAREVDARALGTSIQDFQKGLAAARNLAVAANWEGAWNAFSAALEIADQADIGSEARGEVDKEKETAANEYFMQSLASGKKLKTEGALGEARQHFETALAVATKVERDDLLEQAQDEIDGLEADEYGRLVRRGRDALGAEHQNWAVAREAFQDALAYATDELKDDDKAADARRGLEEVEVGFFRHQMSTANELVKAKKWQEAEAKYEAALSVATETLKSDPLKSEAEEAIRMIKVQLGRTKIADLIRLGEADNNQGLTLEAAAKQAKADDAILGFAQAIAKFETALGHFEKALALANETAGSDTDKSTAVTKLEQIKGSLARNNFQKAIVSGEASFSADDFVKATEYFKAAEQAATAASLDQALTDLARRRRTKAEEVREGLVEYQAATARAVAAENKNDWPSARDAYLAAEGLAKKYELPAKYLTDAMSRGLEAEYQSKLFKAENMEKAGKLEQAILSFRDAAKFASQSRLASEKEKTANERAQRATLKLGQFTLSTTIEKAQEQEKQGSAKLEGKEFRAAATLFGNALNGYQLAETSARQRNMAEQLAKASEAAKRVKELLYVAEVQAEVSAGQTQLAAADELNGDKKFSEADDALELAAKSYTRASVLAEQKKDTKLLTEIAEQLKRIQALQIDSRIDVAIQKAIAIENEAKRLSGANEFAQAATEFLKAQDAYQAAALLAEKSGLDKKQSECDKLKRAAQRLYLRQLYLGKVDVGTKLVAEAAVLARQEEHLEAAKKYQLASLRYNDAALYAKEKNLEEETVEAAALSTKAQTDRHGQEFESLIVRADQLYLSAGVNAQGKEHQAAASDFSKALKLYQASAKSAADNKLDEEFVKRAADKVARTQNNLALQQYHVAMAAGLNFETQKNWGQAKEAFSQASALSKEHELGKELISASGEKLKAVSILAASTTELQDKLDRGKLLLTQEKWQQAYELYAEALEIASFANVKDAKTEAESRRLEAGKAYVTDLQQQANAFLKNRKYQEAIDALDEADKTARHISLAKSIIESLVTEKQSAQKALSASKGFENTSKAGKDALAKRDWTSASRNFSAAAQAAVEAKLEPEQIQEAQRLARESSSMNAAVVEYMRLMAEAEANEKEKDLQAAVDAYSKADGLIAALTKSLGEREPYAATLSNLKGEAALKLDSILPKVANTQLQALKNKGEADRKALKWGSALKHYEEALRVAGAGGAPEEEIASLNAEILALRKLSEGAERFETKMGEGTQLQKEQAWENARMAFQDALSAVKEFGLPTEFGERAQVKLDGMTKLRFDAMVSSAKSLEAQGNFLEANGIYSQAKALGAQESVSEEQLGEVTARLAAIRDKVLAALVYNRGDFDPTEAVKRQAETAQVLGVPARLELPVANGVNMAFRLVPAGEFNMGSNDSERGRDKDESIKGQGKLRIRLTKPYYLSETEVTQLQWRTLMGSNPSIFKEGDDYPVENISWVDCQTFVEKLGKAINRKCRLPTEAEWEAACRAGSTKQYWFGDRTPAVRQMSPNMWFSYNAEQGTRKDEMFDPENPIKRWGRIERTKHSPVGVNIEYKNRGKRIPRKPNPFGLHDMHGNVFEWCLDWYDADYFSLIERTDPYLKTIEKPKERSIRGGAAGCNLWWCRSAERVGEDPLNGYADVGIRVLLEVDL